MRQSTFLVAILHSIRSILLDNFFICLIYVLSLKPLFKNTVFHFYVSNCFHVFDIYLQNCQTHFSYSFHFPPFTARLSAAGLCQRYEYSSSGPETARVLCLLITARSFPTDHVCTGRASLSYRRSTTSRTSLAGWCRHLTTSLSGTILLLVRLVTR